MPDAGSVTTPDFINSPAAPVPKSTAPDAAVPAVRIPMDVRSIALTILAVIAFVCTLELAQNFFVSLLLGILIAYTLSPRVAYFERIRIPRTVGATIVMAGVIGALAFGAYALRGQKQKVQSAAAEVEKATAHAAAASPAPRQSATHVVIDQPGFKLSNLLLVGSVGALGFLGQVVMVLFLAFFLLAGGDRFKRKLVRLTGLQPVAEMPGD